MARSAVKANRADSRAMAAASARSPAGGVPRSRAPNTLRQPLRSTWRACASSARPSASASFASTAAISSSTCGWQRTAPWPKMISARVSRLAPSTVIAIGAWR